MKTDNTQPSKNKQLNGNQSDEATCSASSERLFRAIGLALSSSHNCIATDDVVAEADENSWRIDHGKEIEAFEELMRRFNIDTGLVYGHGNMTHETKQLESC